MENTKGTTIQIFLPDDDPRGIRVAEVTTGVVSALQIPRQHISHVRRLCADLRLPEAAVYLLFESDKDSVKPRVYIGQTDKVSRRFKEHDLKKDFWETALFFVSQKWSFTPTHTEFIEWYATDVASKVGRFNVLANKSACPEIRLPLKQEIIKCFEVIRFLSATLGFPVFEPIATQTAHLNNKKHLLCQGDGADARGLFVGNEFVVLKGSRARRRIAVSAIGKISPIRNQLIEAGVLTGKNTSLVFNQDFPFGSPSTAANVVLGRNVDGWYAWKDSSGRTIDQMYRSQSE